MEAARGRTRRPLSRSPSTARRPATRSTTRHSRLAKGAPMGEHVEKSLREAVELTCSTPAPTWPNYAQHSQLHSSITPPSSRQGTPEVAEQGPLGSVKPDPAETALHRDERMYPTPPPGKLFASVTLRECYCHSQTNVTSLEALHQLKDVLVAREGNYKIDPQYMSRHHGLEARMRRILFDWLMEVCEVMVLRRETFHLAVNLFDRYMSAKRDIRKDQLQLVGVTCLFIAGKLEEIYPPKASAFSYVTEHISENEIRSMELEVLVVVGFRLNAVTANTWVAFWMLYMHTADTNSTSEYDATLFVRIMELIDLALCDVASMDFSNRELALAAFYVVTKNWSLPASLGFQYGEIRECAEWFTSYFAVMAICAQCTQIRSFDEVPDNEALNIQDHKFTLEEFTAGRDGPKRHLDPPPGYGAPISPVFLTPVEPLSEELDCSA